MWIGDRIRTRVLLWLALALYGGVCSAAARAEGYFPAWIDGASVSLIHSAPPVDAPAGGASQPAPPLFMEQFAKVAKSAVSARWLPSRMDDPVYLQHGDGAYAARTAHEYKAYEIDGYRVVLKSFLDRLVVRIQPVPVAAPAAALDLIRALTGDGGSSSGGSRYAKSTDGAPAVLEGFLASIPAAVLTPNALPVSADHLKREMRNLSVSNGGLLYTYIPAGPIVNPSTIGASAPKHTVIVWTNGVYALIQIAMIRPDLSRMYNAFYPESVTPVSIPGVARVVGRSEWTDTQGRLVPTREEAGRESIRIEGSDGWVAKASVGYPTKASVVAEAAWLGLARHTIDAVAGSRYDPGVVQHEAQSRQSAKEALAYVSTRRSLCLDALRTLESAPCPSRLKDAGDEIAAILGDARASWDIAWREWDSAGGSADGIDYARLTADIESKLQSKGLSRLEWWKATTIVDKAAEDVGIKVSLD